MHIFLSPIHQQLRNKSTNFSWCDRVAIWALAFTVIGTGNSFFIVAKITKGDDKLRTTQKGRPSAPEIKISENEFMNSEMWLLILITGVISVSRSFGVIERRSVYSNVYGLRRNLRINIYKPGIGLGVKLVTFVAFIWAI